GADTVVAEIAAAPLFRFAKTDQAANGYSRAASPDERRSNHRHRRGPTSDVGGPILSVHKDAPVDHERRPGNDGIWFACCRRRTTRLARPTRRGGGRR